MESAITTDFIKGNFISLANLPRKDALLRIYGQYRLGKYKQAREEFENLDLDLMLDEFQKSFYKLLDYMILKNDQNLEEPIIDILKPLSLEIKIDQLKLENNLNEALQFENSISKTSIDSNHHLYGILFQKIGDIYRELEEFDKALSLYQLAHQFCQRIVNNFIIIDVMIAMSDIYRKFENFEEMDRLLNNAIELSEQLDYLNGKQLYHQTTGTNYFRRGDYDLAKFHIRESLEMRLTYSHPNQVAQSKMILGMIYLNISDFDTALLELESSKDIYSKVNNEEGKANINSLLAYTYEYNGQLERAITTYKEICRFWETKNDNLNIAESLMSISSVQTKMGQFDSAIQNLLQAQELTGPLNLQLMGRINQEIGDIHRIRGDIGQAIMKYQLALSNFNRVNNSHEQAIIYEKLGVLKFFSGNIKEAEKQFFQSLVLQEEIKNKISLSGLYFWIIRCFIARKKTKQKIESYFMDLEQLYQSSDNVYVQLYYFLAKLLIGIDSIDLIQLGEVKKTVVQLLSQNIPDIELFLNFNLIYLEVLLIEYTKLGNEKISDELIKLSSKLIEYTEEKELLAYFGELNIILAKVYLHEKNFNQAKTLLSEALNITLQRSMFRIALLISKELDNLEMRVKQSSPITDLIGNDTNLFSNKELHEILNNEQIDQKGNFIIFLDNSWKILYQRSFSVSEILANKINTIVEICKNLYSNEKNPQLLIYEQINNFNVILLNSTLFCIYVFNGSPVLASEKLRLLHNKIENSSFLHQVDLQDEKNEHYLEYELKQFMEGLFITEVKEEVDFEQLVIPQLSNSQEFNEFLHPVKFLLMSLFDRNYLIPRSFIQKIVKINPGTLKRHLDSLVQDNYIEKSLQFLDSSPRDMYSISPQGSIVFSRFKQYLHSLL